MQIEVQENLSFLRQVHPGQAHGLVQTSVGGPQLTVQGFGQGQICSGFVVVPLSQVCSSDPV